MNSGGYKMKIYCIPFSAIILSGIFSLKGISGYDKLPGADFNNKSKTIQLSLKPLPNARVVTTFSNGKLITCGKRFEGFLSGLAPRTAADSMGSKDKIALPDNGVFPPNKYHLLVMMNFSNTDAAVNQARSGDTDVADACCFALPAPNTDTLLVRNTGADALANAVLGDTLPNGNRADLNRVYLLLRGERYINRKTISSNGYHLRITGQSAHKFGADPGPAVLQLAPDSLRFLYNDRVVDRIIDAHGDLTISNVWFLSWVASGAQLWEPIIEEKDSSNVRINRCVFEWQEGPAVHVTGKWTNVFLTNNMFRNAIYKDEWWAGRVLYYNSPADTLVEINNTLENVGFGLIQSQGIGLNYYFCDHNTVVNCAKFCWLESYYKTAFIANNLLVNCHFTGERMKDRRFQDPDTLLYGQTINIDTLKSGGRRISPGEAIKLYGSDAVQFTGDRTMSPTDPRELGRVVVYCNNASYFDTSAFYGFYRKYNATVSSDAEKILPEPVTNSRTQSMWAWHPRMINRGSIDGLDPGFKLIPDNMRLILAFLEDMYSPSPKNNVLWGYDPDNPLDPASARNMTTIYENSSRGKYPTKEDFAYNNLKLLKAGLDGYPVGDLNWFPDKLSRWKYIRDLLLMLIMIEKGK
jgi:hypothetical protein